MSCRLVAKFILPTAGFVLRQNRNKIERRLWRIEKYFQRHGPSNNCHDYSRIGVKCLCGTKVFNLTLFTRLLNLCTTHHNIATLISVVIKPVSVLAIWYKLRPFLLLLEITHPCRGQIFATVSIIFAANPLWASASRDHRLRYWPLYYIRFCIRKTLTFVNNYLSAEDDFSVYPIRFYHSLRILVLIRFLSGVTCQGSVDFICFFFPEGLRSPCVCDMKYHCSWFYPF